uniref:Uncharacterized protein n=1 Tax=Megaselia scalaris TaxID=36166 RepID=T1GRK2_MEGSC
MSEQCQYFFECFVFGLRNLLIGKPIPTVKFAIQLTRTAMAMALGLGPCENNSAVIIHGIEPGPRAKNITKAKTETTER